MLAIELGKVELAGEWLQHAWKKVPERNRKDNIQIIKHLVNQMVAVGQ